MGAAGGAARRRGVGKGVMEGLEGREAPLSGRKPRWRGGGGRCGGGGREGGAGGRRGVCMAVAGVMGRRGEAAMAG
jgi:hypothetical protein